MITVTKKPKELVSMLETAIAAKRGQIIGREDRAKARAAEEHERLIEKYIDAAHKDLNAPTIIEGVGHTGGMFGMFYRTQQVVKKPWVERNNPLVSARAHAMMGESLSARRYQSDMHESRLMRHLRDDTESCLRADLNTLLELQSACDVAGIDSLTFPISTWTLMLSLAGTP